MPIYSSDLSEYNQRVYRNERDTDQEFGTEEFLYRRFPKSSLVNNGWPTPLTFTLEEKSGVSVNRSRYSLPQDVLEPDCCNGNHRPGMVVLEFQVRDLPERIATDGREYLFVPKHVPYECCYAHSEIWCNTSGDINQANEKPSKTIRNLFRARLLVKIQEVGRLPREFPEIATVDR